MTFSNPGATSTQIDQSQRSKLSSLSVNLALVANVILAILKTTVGIYAHSSALLADGINSTSDVFDYSAVAFFIRASRKPADDEHPYGHSQFESIGALVIAAFIITAAFTIFWNSVIICLISVLSDLRNFRLAGMLKKRFFTRIVVPLVQPAGSWAITRVAEI